jgi:hypothetical protein
MTWSTSLVWREARRSLIGVALVFGATVNRADAQARWSIEREQGEVTEVDGVPITVLSPVALSRRGDLAAYDWRHQTVVVIPPGGGKPMRVGGTGRDSTAFLSVNAVRFLGDTLAVYDAIKWQLSFFLGGKLRRSESLMDVPRRPPYREILPIAILSDGSMLGDDRGSMRRSDGTVRYFVVEAMMASRWGKTTKEATYVRFIRPGRAPEDRPIQVDTAFEVKTIEEDFRAVAADGKGSITGRQPWLGDELFAMSPTGDLIVRVRRPAATSASGGSYVVTARTIRSKGYEVEIPYRPVPLSDSIADDWVAAYVSVDSAMSFPSMAAACSAVKKSLRKPAFLPPVKQVLVAIDGFVWIERDLGQRLASPRVWDVLDSTGQLVANVTTPLELKVLAIASDVLWGLEANFDGSSRVVRYRIKRG